MNPTLIVTLLCFSLLSFGQDVSEESLIAGAILAASEEQRTGAMVYGYDGNGDLIVLKIGTNEIICIADNPKLNGFHVACYHKDLEPFMARSRELRKEGKNNGEIFEIKEEEAKTGKLKMPKHPTTLHILSGPDGYYDSATNKVVNASYRYVVYIPFATQETTGLPLRPVTNGGPWLMDAGTHRAHIMISTPNN